jgi:NAD-dependent SIR2 family protein deacetylase
MDNESIVRVEYAAATREGRQPRCPYCKKPLEVQQTLRDRVIWTWDEKLKQYVKTCEDDADAPRCVACEEEDWNFVDHVLVRF